MGTMNLIPTAKYLPLRFFCVRTLLMLAEALDIYIPLGDTLLSVLESAEVSLA